MNDQIVLDPERQLKARQYARISRRLMLIDLVIAAIFMFLWLFARWSSALQGLIEQYTGNPWLAVFFFSLVFGGTYFLISLPLSFYEEYLLPHRFEQSNQTVKGWVSDTLKGLLISAIIGLLFMEIIYFVLRAAPETWWLFAAGFMFLFNVLLSSLGPVLLMPVFNKFSPLQDEHADLVERLEELARRANLSVAGIFKFDISQRSKSANAALTGLGKTRRIILGDTLINEFTPDEIETVIAHEMGHHAHKDIPLGILFSTCMTLLGFYLASIGLKIGVNLFALEKVSDVASMPLFFLMMGLYGLVTMPVSNIFSRWRETRADQFALHITNNGQAYASALTRLANQNLANVDPEKWVEFLLLSHPPLKKRIEMAQSFMRSQ